MSLGRVLGVLDAIAFGYELLDKPQARGYASAARALRGITEDLVELHEQDELGDVRGVGPRTVELVGLVLAGETPPQLKKVEERVPAGLFELRRVRGLGAKKIRTLWQDLGITTLGELEYACIENRLLDLAGFGPKTQEKVLVEIARVREWQGRCRLDQAWAVATQVSAIVGGLLVGEARRACETVRGVEVLVDEPIEAALEALGVETPEFSLQGVVVQLHACPPARRGTKQALLSAGPKHLDRLRARATEVGLDLETFECRTEEALYEALGVHAPAVERRDSEDALVLRSAPGPRLVRRSDLLGALHNHTTSSDGRNTLEKMRAAAEAQGLTYFGVSEHSVSAFYAHGMEVERLRAQVEHIARLNEGPGCTLLTGIESDILASGELDYAPEVLSELEVIIASIHSRHGQTPEQTTARMLKAASNPWTHVMGHPTGRLLLGRAPADYDVEAFLDACAENGCAVELNSSPHRLDLNEQHLAMAKARGLLVSIAADAHCIADLDFLDYGVAIARRAGLTAEDVLNCRPLPELRAWLSARRTRALAA